MRDSFDNGLAQASSLFMDFLPRLLLAAVIIAVGYFVGKAICKVLSNVLDRVGFNRLVERGGVKRTLESSGWDAGMILSKLVFYFIMLFVLQMAFGVFGPNPISTILTDIIAFLPNIFVAVVIVVLAAAFSGVAKQLIQVALGGLSYGRMIGNGAAAAILVVGLTAALNQLQIAPAIVNGLFYAMLAVIVGVTIVAVGGGGIAPMRARWERALNRIGEEVPRIQQASKGAPERVEAKGSEWKQQASAAANPPPAPQPLPPVGQQSHPTEQPGMQTELGPDGRLIERRSPPGRRVRGPGEDI